MRKLILTAIIFCSIGISSAFAQEFNVGAHVGVPVGDIKDESNFALGADLSYLWSPTGIFKVGPKVGYHTFFAEADGVDNLSFLPVAAEGRVSLGGMVFVGADLGYGIGLTDGVDGGFYYAPKLGFGLFGVDIIGSYTSFSLEGGTASSVNVGVEFGF